MSDLKTLQRGFTEHLRNPDVVPVPDGLDPRRMGIYSSLIFGNLSSLLADFFPVIKSLLSEDQWQQLVREYFITHQSQTPYFPEIAEEFVAWLSASQLPVGYPVFMKELAHYEWVELALFMMDEDLPDRPVPSEVLRDGSIALSPLAQPLAYHYPVHLISPDHKPAKPRQPTYLLVLRDVQDDVRFFELQPLAFQLLAELHDRQSMNVSRWLGDKAEELGAPDKTQFVHQGLALLDGFNQHHAFIALA